MEDYTSNSYKSKRAEAEAPEERKKAEKVVNGPVKVRKKNELQKAAGSILSNDLPTVFYYILNEEFVPAVKKFIDDAISNGVHRLLYGESSKRSKDSSRSKISYDGYYKGDDKRPTENQVRSNMFEYENIVIEHRGDAEAVLDDLLEAIDCGYLVSVADLYDKLGVTAPHTSHKYGWSDLSGARIVHTRDGYILKMPKPKPFD